MIFDSLKNASCYYGVSTRLERAFDYLQSVDLDALEAGRYPIDGDDIFVNIMDRELKRPEDAKLEVHNTYIDIQVVIRGVETFGWSERAHLSRPKAAFDAEKDIQFFEDTPQTHYTLTPGQFTIFLPCDGHAPMIGEGMVKKAIVKVRVD